MPQSASKKNATKLMYPPSAHCAGVCHALPVSAQPWGLTTPLTGRDAIKARAEPGHRVGEQTIIATRRDPHEGHLDLSTRYGSTGAPVGASVPGGLPAPALKQVYHRYHNAPVHLWPGFEEYAVLYGDSYKEKCFPYATSLSGLHPEQWFRLRWNPACIPVVQGDKVVLQGSTAVTQIGYRFYELLASARYHTLETLWDAALGQPMMPQRQEHETLLRAYIERLIGQGLLQLEIMENR